MRPTNPLLTAHNSLSLHTSTKTNQRNRVDCATRQQKQQKAQNRTAFTPADVVVYSQEKLELNLSHEIKAVRRGAMCGVSHLFTELCPDKRRGCSIPSSAVF